MERSTVYVRYYRYTTLIAVVLAAAEPGAVFADYNKFSACLGGLASEPLDPACLFADFDEDGDVDLFDSAMFEDYCTAAGSSTCRDESECDDGDIMTLDECVSCGSESYCNNEALPGYPEWFADNPNFSAATITSRNFVPDAINRMWKDIRLLERVGAIYVAPPANLCVEPEDCRRISLSNDEIRDILAARAAHAAWIDKNNYVSWSIDENPIQVIERMVYGAWSYNADLSQYTGAFEFVVDHSPSDAFAYILKKGHIKDSPEASIASVLDDVRSDFLHGNIHLGDPVDTACTLNIALHDYRSGTRYRVARLGCHSMTRIIRGVLAGMNIPSFEQRQGDWFYPGHSSLEIPALAAVISHGDSVYDSSLDAVPSVSLPTRESWYDSQYDSRPCGIDMGCIAERDRILKRVEYPAHYSLLRCCKPADWGYVSCEDYLEQLFGDCLLAEEIPALAAQLSEECGICGNGVLEDGEFCETVGTSGLCGEAAPRCVDCLSCEP